MELRHLRTFITVAETLNISAAARRVRLSQPALSRHIRELEHAVGHALFSRRPGGLALTPAGATLRDHGAKALQAFDEALRVARRVGGSGEATLRVGYYGSISIWARLLAPALEKLGRKFPQTTAQVVESTPAQLAAALGEGRLDVAILGPGRHPRLPGVAIEVACSVPGQAVVAVNHRLAKKRTIAIEDLRDEEIVGVNEELSPGRNEAVMDACRAAGFTPRLEARAASFAELITRVKQRMGVAVIGPFALTTPHPGVVFVRLRPPAVNFDIHVGRAVHAAPPAHALAGLIVAEARRAAQAA